MSGAIWTIARVHGQMFGDVTGFQPVRPDPFMIKTEAISGGVVHDLTKRLAWGCESLAEGERRPCCWPGRPHRQRHGLAER